MKNTKNKLVRLIAILTIISLLAVSNGIVIPVQASAPQPEKIADNTWVMPQPPTGFDPLNASPQELKTYGFPQKPTDDGAMKAWQQAMKASKYWVQPQVSIVYDIQHNEIAPSYDTDQSGRNGTGQGSYAGIAVQRQNNGNSPYSLSTTEFVVPTYQKGLSNGGIISYWTGIGGVNLDSYGNNSSYSIVQAGVDANLTYYPSSNFPNLPPGTNYALWYEFRYGNNPCYYLSNPIISAGDDVYISVSCPLSAPWMATLFVIDETTSQYLSLQFNVQNYDSCSAEWEYERVAGGNDNIPQVLMYNCYCQTSAGTWSAFGPLQWTRCRSGIFIPWFVQHRYPVNIGTSSFTIH